MKFSDVPTFSQLTDPHIPALLKEGKIGVIPTDTVYGVVCDASNEAAVQRLYAAKHREGKPGTVIAASVEQLVQLGLKARYLKAVEKFWPGPISVIIPSYDLHYLHLGKLSVAVRIPAPEDINTLLTLTGPLLSSSANITTQPVATTIEQAQQYFGDTVDFYIDGGDMSAHKASTLLRVLDDAIEVLRHGDVDVDEAGHIISK